MLGVGFAFEPAVQEADVEVQAEGGVADHLVEVAHGQIVVADVADGGAGRGVDVEAGVFAELADAEEMSAVGDDDDVLQVVFAGDGGEAVDLLFGVDGAGLGDDVAEGDAIGEEVVAADAAFGVAGVFVGAAAEGDDERGDLLAVELDGVVETGVEDGRGMAGVLGRSEDGDGVGGLGFVVAGDGVDLTVEPDAPGGHPEEHEGEELTEEGAPQGASAQVGGRSDHVCQSFIRAWKFHPGPAGAMKSRDRLLHRVSLQGAQAGDWSKSCRS